MYVPLQYDRPTYVTPHNILCCRREKIHQSTSSGRRRSIFTIFIYFIFKSFLHPSYSISLPPPSPTIHWYLQDPYYYRSCLCTGTLFRGDLRVARANSSISYACGTHIFFFNIRVIISIYINLRMGYLILLYYDRLVLAARRCILGKSPVRRH